MKPVKPSSVVIFPSTLDRPLLEDVVQALYHVNAIMAINDDETLEPGHLHGMTLMLENAEQVLTEMRSALPPARRSPRPPAPGSTAWPPVGHTLTLSH